MGFDGKLWSFVGLCRIFYWNNVINHQNLEYKVLHPTVMARHTSCKPIKSPHRWNDNPIHNQLQLVNGLNCRYRGLTHKSTWYLILGILDECIHSIFCWRFFSSHDMMAPSFDKFRWRIQMVLELCFRHGRDIMTVLEKMENTQPFNTKFFFRTYEKMTMEVLVFMLALVSWDIFPMKLPRNFWTFLPGVQVAQQTRGWRGWQRRSSHSAPHGVVKNLRQNNNGRVISVVYL